MRIRLTTVKTNRISQKRDVSFHATLQMYVCLLEVSVSTGVFPIVDLEDGRMEVHSFVWWVIQWSVCN